MNCAPKVRHWGFVEYVELLLNGRIRSRIILTTQAFPWQSRRSESPTGALTNRGSATYRLDDETISSWYESAAPLARGRPLRYLDLAITTVLVVKRVFRLTLRAAQSFIDSIFALMGVQLHSPD